MSYDALTVVVWILRIVLPCVLFWISFGTKLRLPWNSATVSENSINRETMLLHCKAVAKGGFPTPESLANIMLVDQQSAPSLFQEGRSRGGRGAGGERGDRERGGRKREVDREDRPKGGTDQRRERKRQPSPPKDEEEEEEPVNDASEEKMHLESLVNFVAFSKREQQRVFLPDAESAPPPPPKPPQKAASALNEKGAGASAAAPQANAEAQMVLRGAMKVGSRGAAVARCLHTQLTDNGIDISPASFELMVEASVQATELQCASDFLMRMEAAGHTPSNELLDRVMELYLQRKRDGATKSETEALEASKFARTAAGASSMASVPSFVGTLGNDDAMNAATSLLNLDYADASEMGMDPASLASRSKLCASAAPFVPTTGESGPGGADGSGMQLTASALPFTPMGMISAERTKLSATALPFVPGGNDEMASAEESPENEPDGKNGGKGKGRGKAKAKQQQRVYKVKQTSS